MLTKLQQFWSQQMLLQISYTYYMYKITRTSVLVHEDIQCWRESYELSWDVSFDWTEMKIKTTNLNNIHRKTYTEKERRENVHR